MAGAESTEPSMTFCEGCPFANGVQEVDGTIWHNFQMEWPNPGFDLFFKDRNDETLVTNKIDVDARGDIDSSMPAGTARVVERKVNKCHEPTEVEVKRLGGLAGKKTVVRCGAFPDQKPSRIHMQAETTGWFSPLDFM